MHVDVKKIDRLLEELSRVSEQIEAQGDHTTIESLTSLEEIRATLRQLLLTGTRSHQTDVRRCSVYGLSKVGSSEDLPVIIGMLSDRDAAVRAWAVEGLGRLAQPETLGALIATLADPDAFVYYSTVLALRKFPVDLIVRPLMDALCTPDSLVRQRAAKLLGNLRDSRAVEALSSCFHCEEASVRYEVVEALCQIGERRVTRVLVAALGDEDRDVRCAAIKGLQRLGDEAAVEPLVRLALNNEEQRASAMEALMQICGPDAVVLVHRALMEIEARAEHIATSLIISRANFRLPNLWEWDASAAKN